MTQPPHAALDQSSFVHRGGISSSSSSSFCPELGHSADNNKSATTIPTAIVKPKYQKIQHDDRQLLTNAGGYVDYNYKSANRACQNSFSPPSSSPSLANLNNLCANKRVHNNKLQAAFEEATRKKKSVAGLRRDNQDVQSSPSNAIVGVVTPRKKNYNENRSAPGNKSNSNNKKKMMNSELCLGGGGGGGGAISPPGNNQKATDCNENNVISDKSSNGRTAMLLQKRSLRRQAKENMAG